MILQTDRITASHNLTRHHLPWGAMAALRGKLDTGPDVQLATGRRMRAEREAGLRDLRELREMGVSI